MQQAMLAVMILGLAGLVMAAPTVAMADHDSDMPYMVLTIVCTIYTDQMDEAISSMDRILGTGIGDQMNECTINTEFAEVTVESATMVDVSAGSLFPVCADDDSCFVPHTVTVDAGEEVAWTNSDTVLHTVTDSGGMFDNWLLPGDGFSYVFEEPGVYAYGCTVHPWASGVVVVDSVAGEAEVMSDSAETDAQAVVEDLIALYRQDGTDAFAEINAGADANAAVTGFIIDISTDSIVAHSTDQRYVGLVITPVLEASFIQREVMLAIIEQEDEGVWLSYPVPDPSGNLIGYERGWFKMYDGYVFGGRYYVAEDVRVQSIVQEMIRQYTHNPEQAFGIINEFESTDPHYPFVLDPETQRIVAHGANSDRVGDIAIVFTDSTVSLEEFRNLAEGDGVWAEYEFFNPATGMDQDKRSWLVKHDGYIFGSGYYP